MQIISYINKFLLNTKDYVENSLEKYVRSKYATYFLFLLGFIESIFFPIPTDILLLAMCYYIPKRSIFFGFIATVSSVMGGVIGYLLGAYLFNIYIEDLLINQGLIGFFQDFALVYQKQGALALFIAGFSPIPYKVATIASGALSMNLVLFILISIIARGGRFFLVAFLVQKFHHKGKILIDKYFLYIVWILTFLISILYISYVIFT